MNKKGFSLTELLVVMIIIAILSTVVIGSSIGYINKAKKTKDEELIMALNQILINEEIKSNTETEQLVKSINKYEIVNMKLTQDDYVLVWNKSKNKIEMYESNKLGNKSSSIIEINYVNNEAILREGGVEYVFLDLSFIEELYDVDNNDLRIKTSFNSENINYKILKEYLKNVQFIDEAERQRQYFLDKDYEFGNALKENLIFMKSVITVRQYYLLNNTALKTVVFTNGLRSIERKAFMFCSNLEKVIFTDDCSLVEVGEEAFRGCEILKEVKLPKYTGAIRRSAFSNCFNIENVYIPEHVKRIEIEAFGNCVKLQNFIVNEDNMNYTSIDGVIYSKDKKTLVLYPSGKTDNEYKVIDGTNKIEDYAFNYVKSLLILRTNNELLEIGNYAMSSAYLLKEVYLTDNIQKIGKYAFKYCTKLKNINIPKSLFILEEGTFYGCDDLSKIILNDGLEKIEKLSFSYSTYLYTVVVPSSVSVIEKKAFNCSYSVRIFIYYRKLMSSYEIELAKNQKIYFYDDWNLDPSDPKPI